MEILWAKACNVNICYIILYITTIYDSYPFNLQGKNVKSPFCVTSLKINAADMVPNSFRIANQPQSESIPADLYY